MPFEEDLSDPRSSILKHLPPLRKLTVLDARRSKLLNRLRLEGQEYQRQLEERRRQKYDFFKSVLRQKAKLAHIHGKRMKLIKRLTQNLLKYFASSQKTQDTNTAEQQYNKERLSALRARDEVQYIKLLRETKNQRLLELIRQTEQYMNQLGALVTEQRKSELQTDRNQLLFKAEHTQNSPKQQNLDNESNFYESLLAARDRYFTLTHSVQEEIVSTPKVLKGGTLREYQLKGLNWLVSLYNNNLNGILADAMGLGKTIQTIALLGYLYEVKQNNGPFLIVAPLSTLHSGWDAELKTWLPSFVRIVYDGSKEYRKVLRQKYFTEIPSFNVLLTTDAFIMRDYSYLKKFHWEYLIVDEAHRLKNPKSKLAQVLAEKKQTNGFKIRRRLALTGTPLQNDLQEVWALLNFLMPRIFSSSETFRSWFNAPLAQVKPHHQVKMTEEEELLVVDRLHKVLRPFLLRREKKEVENEVPPKHEEVIWCPLSGVQRGLYTQIENGTILGVSASSNTLLQLRKVCNHPYLFCQKTAAGPDFPADESIIRVCGKFWVLDDILTKLYTSKHRVLIFSQMVRLLNVLEAFLSMRGWRFLRLDGGTSSEERLKRLQLFNDANSPFFVFALSTRAGGLGVNLQSADTVIIYDSDWNPQNDEQAQSRAHRIGQTREVLILRLVTPDTVEERILAAAGVKLDKDALIIKSGMFYDSAHDLEDERRNRVKAILSKRGQRQAVTFFEHGAINRQLARTDNEFQLFTSIDKSRKLLGYGDLFEDVVLPPCLLKAAFPHTLKHQMHTDWHRVSENRYMWKAKDAQKCTDSTYIFKRKSCINQSILKALIRMKQKPFQKISAPFWSIPSQNDFPTYRDIVETPMCLEYIENYARSNTFTSAMLLEEYLALIVDNCRLFNGSDHSLFHEALHLMSIIITHVRVLCCVEFGYIDVTFGFKTKQEVQKIIKILSMFHSELLPEPQSSQNLFSLPTNKNNAFLYISSCNEEDDESDDEENASDITDSQISLSNTTQHGFRTAIDERSKVLKHLS